MIILETAVGGTTNVEDIGVPGERKNGLRGIEWVKFIGESSRMGSRQGFQQFLHLKQVDQVDVVLLRRP